MELTTQIVGAGALLFGSVTLALTLQAQPIYRCANSYSQTPCAGGVAIDAQDSRSPTQKAQSEAATVQAIRLANEMERTRLNSEQVAVKKNGSPAASTKSATAKNKTPKPVRGQKDAQPSPFVAFAPAQEKPVAKKTDRATAKP